MKTLVIDARMAKHAGIGVYLRSLLAHFKETASFNISLLISEMEWQSLPTLHAFNPIFCDIPIYSAKEQLLLPSFIPKCDLFWSPHFNVPLLPIRAKKRIVTISDVYHLDNPLPLVERFYAKSLIKKAVATASQVITLSEFSKGRLFHYFPRYKDKVIAFPLGPGNILSEGKLPCSIPTPFFLFVGSIKPHKNLETLLTAFECFIQWEKTPFHLVIAGKISGMRTSFDLGGYIGSHSALTKIVHVLGEVDEQTLSGLYKHALAFVFPSFYEGWGLPPLEAMQLGCPVIASHAASIPEACGEGALYFDPKNPKELACHLSAVALSKEVREKFIQKGKKQIEKLSWKRCAQNHLDLFNAQTE